MSEFAVHTKRTHSSKEDSSSRLFLDDCRTWLLQVCAKISLVSSAWWFDSGVASRTQCYEFTLVFRSLGHGCHWSYREIFFNGRIFKLVAIEYFTKCVKAASYKSVTKKVVATFVRNNMICRFGISKSVITDNGANLNSHLMREIYEQFKITHRNSTAYCPIWMEQ